jgi:transcription elongation factor GreA
MSNVSTFNTAQEHYFLSQSGLLSLRTKLQDLRSRRLEHIQNLRLAKEQQSDSFSAEDSSYIQELGSLQAIEIEIEKNEHILAHSKLLEEQPRAKDKVGFGSRVKLKAGKKEVEYMIVHSLEADPSQGKISDKSPLGRQLLGKKLRDYITLKPLRRHKPINLKLVSIK